MATEQHALVGADGESTFGTLLRRHRQRAGLTQEALAERARLSVRAISDLERGVKQRPYPATVRLLAEALALGPPERSALEAAARGRLLPAMVTPAPVHGDPMRVAPLHRGSEDVAHSSQETARSMAGVLIGREETCAVLGRAAESVRLGGGLSLLLRGEAGAGKTCLVRHALASTDLLVLEGSALQDVTPPYGPFVAALRSYRRLVGDGTITEAPLAHALALLAPVPDAPAPPRATLCDALAAALSAIARRQPAAVFLDDLHWADSATLEILPSLIDALKHEPLLLVCAYRSDSIPRDHPMRYLRSALRRQGRLQEISVESLDRAQTAQLIGRLLGSPAHPALVATIYERTGGLPFFVEELTLSVADRLQPGHEGLVLDAAGDLPLPESVRDAVLSRISGLSSAAQRAIDVAAVAGLEFDVDLVARLAGGEEGLVELMANGLIVEPAPGRAAFRHALSRDACYAELPWLWRRTMHRQVAQWLHHAGAPPTFIAEHWLAARDTERARPALLAAAAAACRMHAYRDAARAYQRALDLWQDHGDDVERLDALERLGECAELSGDLQAATRAWRAATDGWSRLGAIVRLAAAEHHLAGACELQGDWERALAARDAAAAAFAECGLFGDAAMERLLAAAHVRSAGSFHASLALLDLARSEAERAGRTDLLARILGLEGNVRARLGQSGQGLALVRSGLALALEHNLAGPATEIYQRLADSLEHAGDYAGAQAVYGTATEFCQAHQAAATAQLCLACLTVVLRLTGDWDRAAATCRMVLDSADSSLHARGAASGVLGSLYVLRGQARQGRVLLLESAAIGRRIELAAMELLSAWGLAMLDELTGAHEAGIARCRSLLDRWERTEDRHYVVPALHWASTYCAEHNAAAEARACAAALDRIAAATGQVEALAALAHALGEVALLDGDAAAAVSRFDQALAILQEQPLPFERAQSARRAGAAYLRSGRRDAGVDRLAAAYDTAHRLGARPLATRIAKELAACGAPAPGRSGRTSPPPIVDITGRFPRLQ